MAKFIEVTAKGGRWFVNLDTLDCIKESRVDNGAILSFAGGNNETLSCDENYDEIIGKIKLGEVWSGDKGLAEAIKIVRDQPNLHNQDKARF